MGETFSMAVVRVLFLLVPITFFITGVITNIENVITLVMFYGRNFILSVNKF